VLEGITFPVFKPDTATTIFSVTDAYIFTPKSGADINISALMMMLSRGSYKNIPLSLITVTSNETVVVGGISDSDHFIKASTCIHVQVSEVSRFISYPRTVSMLPIHLPSQARPRLGQLVV